MCVGGGGGGGGGGMDGLGTRLCADMIHSGAGDKSLALALTITPNVTVT